MPTSAPYLSTVRWSISVRRAGGTLILLGSSAKPGLSCGLLLRVRRFSAPAERVVRTSRRGSNESTSNVIVGAERVVASCLSATAWQRAKGKSRRSSSESGSYVCWMGSESANLSTKSCCRVVSRIIDEFWYAIQSVVVLTRSSSLTTVVLGLLLGLLLWRLQARRREVFLSSCWWVGLLPP